MSRIESQASKHLILHADEPVNSAVHQPALCNNKVRSCDSGGEKGTAQLTNTGIAVDAECNSAIIQFMPPLDFLFWILDLQSSTKATVTILHPVPNLGTWTHAMDSNEEREKKVRAQFTISTEQEEICGVA